MSNDERPLIEEILDYAVYAPLGLAITVLEDLPGLVERGKSKLGTQVGIARFASRMAFRQVRSTIDDVLRPTPAETSPSANKAADPNGVENAIIEARAHVTPTPAPELAIPAYDTLAASQIVARLVGLNAEELRSVRAYEETHRGRRTILARITQLEQANDAN